MRIGTTHSINPFPLQEINESVSHPIMSQMAIVTNKQQQQTTNKN